jgi:hypothetical protein
MLQSPQVMGDEVLRAPANPGEITDAQLATISERGSQAEPGRIREGTSPRSSCPSFSRG